LKTNVDWAGVLVEKASGLSLEEYFQKYIFAPLDMKNTTFFPTEEQKSRLVHMSQRAQDGTITSREHVFRLPLVAKPEEQQNIFNSGGGGCYGEPKEFTNIISMLLNNGTSPITSTQLLKPETVDQMFTNQIPQWPNFGRTPIITGRPEYANSVTELYPQPHDQPQGFGLTIFLTIHEGTTGRGKNTGFWGGLPNLFWWVDRERGVGGIVAGQLVPFGGKFGLSSLWRMTLLILM
jgi:CubicO group peptidase (beta-lactamase class C family)